MIRVMKVENGAIEEVELLRFTVEEILESRSETVFDDYRNTDLEGAAGDGTNFIEVHRGDVEFVTVALYGNDGEMVAYIGKREDWSGDK